MKIFIGADHRGYNLKKKIAKFLASKGHYVIDVGTHKKGVSCDFPQFAYKVGTGVTQTKNARGILICMTGLGQSIAANKIPGVRATLCYNKKAAYYSRQHNDANVLVLGAQFTREKDLPGILSTWLKTEFSGGRHLRRINKIKNIEKKFSKSRC